MEFNRLPAEVHLEIFSYLSACEVMKIREVCKQWNGLINIDFKFKRLVCRSRNYFPRNVFNFRTIRSFLDYTSADPKFRRVQYLNAKVRSKFSELQDVFDFLNSFKLLEETKFYIAEPFDGNLDGPKKLVVSLARLKKATFWFPRDIRRGSKVKFLLDLPSLRCLGVDTLEGITIGYPQVLESLFAEQLLKPLELDYSQFTSLKEIQTYYLLWRSADFINFIKKLPNLRELHLFDFYLDLSTDLSQARPPSENATPRIIYFGFEFSLSQILSKGQLPDDFKFGANSAQFISRNLHRSIDNNPHISSIKYNWMIRELNDHELFCVIPQKFPMIRDLFIHGPVADEQRLLKFIGQYEIGHLSFGRTNLPIQFFVQLAENGRSIQELSILNEPVMSSPSGDLDFVFKFKQLTKLNLEGSLPLNFLTRLLSEPNPIKFTHQFYQTGTNLVGCYLSIYRRKIGLWHSGGPRPNIEYNSPDEQGGQFAILLKSRLKSGELVDHQELKSILCDLESENESNRVMMNKFIQEQFHELRHSIYLPLKQIYQKI